MTQSPFAINEGFATMPTYTRAWLFSMPRDRLSNKRKMKKRKKYIYIIKGGGKKKIKGMARATEGRDQWRKNENMLSKAEASQLSLSFRPRFLTIFFLLLYSLGYSLRCH